MKKLLCLPGLFSLVIMLSMSLTSCLNSKRITYFSQLKDTSITLVSKNFEPLIQKGDLLNIAVNSLDPQSSLLFNSQNSLTTVGIPSQQNNALLPGSMVDNNGNIYMPKLGEIKAEGKTKYQLEEELQQKLTLYLKDPVVNIRFMNFRITVLGEVNRPGTVTIPNDKVSILEALGIAGDLTVFGKRESVLLLRENNGVQQIHRLNLNDNSIFRSPYFYLQSNDVLYVEPNNAKAYAGTRSQVLLPSILASLSLVVIVIDRLLTN